MPPTRTPSLVLLALGLAACGSGTKAPAAATAPPTVAAAPAAPPPAAPQPAPAPPAAPSPPPPQAVNEVNPFLQPSALPFHLPPFDRIKDADYAPAFEAGMAEQRKEIDAIAHDPAPATFDNTIIALEHTGQMLARVEKTFGNLNASNTDDAMEKVESEMAPKLAAHRDAIALDAALFARVDTVFQHRGELGLDPESAQLIERYEDLFVRAGARLSDADKATLKKLNEELSSLSTRFRQNVLAATKDGAVVVDDVQQLDGLSQEQIGAAAEAAKARGLDGKWVIALQNTTIQPPLAQMKNRALRERVFRASVMRGRGGSSDNTAVVSRIIELRAKKAALLGYPNYAAYALAEETAGTPGAVNRILDQLAPAALAKARAEAAGIQAQIRADARAAHTAPFTLAPWDWAFYAQEVRKARFSFDEAQVKPYFEINRVLQDGVFFAAHELYGLTFTERHDLPVYQPDVRVFEVHDADGSTIGLLLLDYFKRDNKQGGAWMDTFVDQSTLLGDKPVVINNLNVPKPAPGAPALLTFDDVTGMFHEFGHALHGLLSAVKYPLLSGTSVPPDFVEFPSQFNEMWSREPAVLAHFAKHYQTGEPMPKALLDKILAAKDYGQGYATLEYLAASLVDQSWHQIPLASVPPAARVMAFEDAALARHRVAYPPVPPRYHTTYFSHIFAGGYEAGYYAYIWSEVLARDAGAWFHAHGGLSRAAGDAFRAGILSRGRTQEPSVLFEEFYGHPPDIKPLLEYRGLTLPGQPKH
ncbi:MAG TPA: M3 family metallopeptidase [Kofleriaceae bacterium]|jgi:peptidyl-dipeptidase Dcp|nr:M3 family metallopeptidase [Kofleriaceae bacterium]